MKQNKITKFPNGVSLVEIPAEALMTKPTQQQMPEVLDDDMEPAIVFDSSQYYTVDGTLPAIESTSAVVHDMCDINDMVARSAWDRTRKLNSFTYAENNTITDLVTTSVKAVVDEFKRVIDSIVTTFYARCNIIYAGKIVFEKSSEIESAIRYNINNTAIGLQCIDENAIRHMYEYGDVKAIAMVNAIGVAMYNDVMTTIRNAIAVVPDIYNPDEIDGVNSSFRYAMADMSYEARVFDNNIINVVPAVTQVIENFPTPPYPEINY